MIVKCMHYGRLGPMSTLTVRDVGPEVYAALKRRAKAHHRSLQGEVLSILAAAAQAAPPPEGFGPLDFTVVESGGSGTWSRDEIYDADGR